MQQEIFNNENEQDYEIIIENYSTVPQDIYFEQIVSTLQDIIMQIQFQELQTNFMKKYYNFFDEVEQNKIQYMNIFHQYQNILEKYIQKILNQRIINFSMKSFLQLLQTRTHLIDEQILDMLQSFSDFQVFKRLILDYKAYYEEQQQLQLLTIKSKKISQNKKVQSKTDNIFGGPMIGLDFTTKPLVQSKRKKQTKKEKTEEELLIPELFLTVRPLRKIAQQ